MSALLQTVLKSSDVLSVTVGTDAPDHFISGIPYESDSTLAVDKTTATDHYHQGLPFTAAGRLSVTLDTPTVISNGAAPFASGRLCMEAGTIVIYTDGVSYTSDGSLASTSLA